MMKLEDILKNITYQTILNELNCQINNVVTDTRKIKQNDLYIGIIGENFDGNDFYKEAFERGAKVAILSKNDFPSSLIDYLKQNDKCIIVVEDTIKCLGELASYKRSYW